MDGSGFVARENGRSPGEFPPFAREKVPVFEDPNYAMNLFRRTFGMTLVEFVTQHRVSHAQRLLATTGDKILDVAFSSGFTSLSRFNDAFRNACGCSPSSYRLTHQTHSPS